MHWLKPEVRLAGGEAAPEAARERARLRVKAAVEAEIARRLPVYDRLEAAARTGELTGLARGVAYQWREAGLALDWRGVAASLSTVERRSLKSHGLMVGRVTAYAPAQTNAVAIALALALHGAHRPRAAFQAPAGAPVSFPAGAAPREALAAAGYLKLGPRAVRADIAERLLSRLTALRSADGPAFAVPPETAALIGCPGAVLGEVLRALGLAPAETDPETGAPLRWRFRRRALSADAAGTDQPPRPGPFAVLATLAPAAPPARQRRRRRKARGA
jgi:ATP-dependent RNA helicase SUPV3L1/SUV3